MNNKECPACNSTALVRLYSLYIKICGNCGLKIKWNLDEGQKPLLTKPAYHQDQCH